MAQPCFCIGGPLNGYHAACEGQGFTIEVKERRENKVVTCYQSYFRDSFILDTPYERAEKFIFVHESLSNEDVRRAISYIVNRGVEL